MSAVTDLGNLMVWCGDAGAIAAGLLSSCAPSGSDRERRLALLGVAGSVAATIGGILALNWFVVALGCGCAAIWCWLWRRKRKRRRAARSLSDEARSLVADLVDRAREAARPSPVRRPALGGAT